VGALIASGTVISLARLFWAWAFLVVPMALGFALYGAYLFLSARGGRRFPAAPGSDLKTVLKSIYLQQRFATFAADNQGHEPDELHHAFGQFVNVVRPEDVSEPTQVPGVIRS